MVYRHINKTETKHTSKGMLKQPAVLFILISTFMPFVWEAAKFLLFSYINYVNYKTAKPKIPQIIFSSFTLSKMLTSTY